MLLIRGPLLKRAFLCSSCWAVGPVLNEFVVAMAFVDVDYSSNVGQCPDLDVEFRNRAALAQPV
jgi:hypothetical protein